MAMAQSSGAVGNRVQLALCGDSGKIQLCWGGTQIVIYGTERGSIRLLSCRGQQAVSLDEKC